MVNELTKVNGEMKEVINLNGKEEMKRLNLLFIEGNRREIDKANVVESYNKIKSLGFIKSMPIEYIPMEEAKEKIGERKLMKIEVERMNGTGEAIISNFKITVTSVNKEEYDNYDGICTDGQHRTLALLFSSLKEIEVEYSPIILPEKMDILSYIALRNNGKVWKNEDFYNSQIKTGDEKTDYILDKIVEEYVPAFLFNIFTFGTANLTAKQIKSIQLGYKTLSDYGKVQLNTETQRIGDEILKVLNENSFITKDRLTGRFGAGLKQFYNGICDKNKVIEVIKLINKQTWEAYFVPNAGQSKEAKFFTQAFEQVYINEINNKNSNTPS